MTELEKLKSEIEGIKTRLESALERLKVAEESEEEWPKDGEQYYWLNAVGYVISDTWVKTDGCDEKRMEIGNVFKTEEEANAAYERLKILHEMEEMADFHGNNGDRYYIIYSHMMKECVVHVENLNLGIPAFKDCNKAYECIQKIGEERLKKYWFKV